MRRHTLWGLIQNMRHTFKLQQFDRYIITASLVITQLNDNFSSKFRNSPVDYPQFTHYVFSKQSSNILLSVVQKFRLNTLRPRQNGHLFPDDNFKRIFVNEYVWVSIKLSLKFVPKGQINDIPALVQIMAWRRPGDKPLSEPMLVSLLTHICVTRPQWVKRWEAPQLQWWIIGDLTLN